MSRQVLEWAAEVLNSIDMPEDERDRMLSRLRERMGGREVPEAPGETAGQEADFLDGLYTGCEALGDLFFRMGLPGEAISVFQRLADKVDTGRAWNDLGVALSKARRYRDAVRCYKRALKRDRGDPTVWFNLGKAMYRLGMYEQAMGAFKNAVSLDPHNKSACNNLGVAYRQMGLAEKALECYRKAVEIDPQYAWAWHNMGVLYLFMGKKEEARRFFHRALSCDPGYRAARDMLETYYGEGVE